MDLEQHSGSRSESVRMLIDDVAVLPCKIYQQQTADQSAVRTVLSLQPGVATIEPCKLELDCSFSAKSADANINSTGSAMAHRKCTIHSPGTVVTVSGKRTVFVGFATFYTLVVLTFSAKCRCTCRTRVSHIRFVGSKVRGRRADPTAGDLKPRFHQHHL
jgi:hypothetical protein